MRGRYPRRVVLAATSHPLGLFRRTAILSNTNEMVSEPARMRLPSHVLEALERPQAETVTRDERGDEEFHHMREYSVGMMACSAWFFAIHFAVAFEFPRGIIRMFIFAWWGLNMISFIGGCGLTASAFIWPELFFQ